LYSTGGTDPSFTKNGKSWNTIGTLRSHLRVLSKRGETIYRNQGVVIQKLETIVVEEHSFDEELQRVADKKAEEQRKRDKQHADWQRKRDEEELQRLAKKLGKDVS
jgi:hypothetical protein